MLPPLPQRVEPSPWGFWATIAFSVTIAGGYLAPQVVIGIVMGIVEAGRSGGAETDWEEFAARLESDGSMLAMGVLSSVPIVVGMAVWFASLRKGISVRDYLGLKWPEGSSRTGSCSEWELWEEWELWIGVARHKSVGALTRGSSFVATPVFACGTTSWFGDRLDGI